MECKACKGSGVIDCHNGNCGIQNPKATVHERIRFQHVHVCDECSGQGRSAFYGGMVSPISARTIIEYDIGYIMDKAGMP